MHYRTPDDQDRLAGFQESANREAREYIGWAMHMTDSAIFLLGTAIAMHACVKGWNAACHRKADRLALALAALFWLLAAFIVYEGVRIVI